MSKKFFINLIRMLLNTQSRFTRYFVLYSIFRKKKKEPTVFCRFKILHRVTVWDRLAGGKRASHKMQPRECIAQHRQETGHTCAPQDKKSRSIWSHRTTRRVRVIKTVYTPRMRVGARSMVSRSFSVPRCPSVNP